MSILRKALKPYTFANGDYHVPLGQIACAPAWELMHIEAKYSNADSFDGLRFVKQVGSTIVSKSKDESMLGTTFTDVSQDFPIWGYGSKVWYATFHLRQA